MINHTHGPDNDFAFPRTISVYFIRDGKSLMAPSEKSVIYYFSSKSSRGPSCRGKQASTSHETMKYLTRQMHKGAGAGFGSRN